MLERRRHTSACRFGLRTSAAKSGDKRIKIDKDRSVITGTGAGTKWENCGSETFCDPFCDPTMFKEN